MEGALGTQQQQSFYTNTPTSSQWYGGESADDGAWKNYAAPSAPRASNWAAATWRGWQWRSYDEWGDEGWKDYGWRQSVSATNVASPPAVAATAVTEVDSPPAAAATTAVMDVASPPAVAEVEAVSAPIAEVDPPPPRFERPNYAPPPEFLGLEELELYRINIDRWMARSGYKKEQLAGVIVQHYPVEMQKKLKDFARALDAEDGVDKLFDKLKLFAGQRPEDLKNKAFAAAMFEHTIRKNESVTEYVIRRESQWQRNAEFGSDLPSDI